MFAYRACISSPISVQLILGRLDHSPQSILTHMFHHYPLITPSPRSRPVPSGYDTTAGRMLPSALEQRPASQSCDTSGAGTLLNTSLHTACALTTAHGQSHTPCSDARISQNGKTGANRHGLDSRCAVEPKPARVRRCVSPQHTKNSGDQ